MDSVKTISLTPDEFFTVMKEHMLNPDKPKSQVLSELGIDLAAAPVVEKKEVKMEERIAISMEVTNYQVGKSKKDGYKTIVKIENADLEKITSEKELIIETMINLLRSLTYSDVVIGHALSDYAEDLLDD